MNQQSNKPTLYSALRHRLRKIAWTILELHHRLFGPRIDPSRLPDTLNSDDRIPKDPLGPSA